MKRCTITVSTFILFSKIKLFTINPLSTDAFPWLTIKINFKTKFNYFAFSILSTQILKAEDIKSIGTFVKIMKFYTILFHNILYKVKKLTHGTVTF